MITEQLASQIWEKIKSKIEALITQQTGSEPGAGSASVASHNQLSDVTQNQHHNKSHTLATPTALGVDHSVSGLTVGHVLKATASDAAAFGTVPSHDIISSHSLTGSALQLVGATATNTLGLLTPSANPGVASAILKSDAAGKLQLATAQVDGALNLAADWSISRIAANVAGLVSGDAIEGTYTSGWTGGGFHLDYNQTYANQAFLELDRLSVRGIMNVYELLIHQIRATNGSIFVANTGKAKAVEGTGPYWITTETDHGFAVNDLIRAQRFTGTGTYQCDMTVTAVTDSTHFTAALRATYTAPAVGMEFVRLGNTTDTSRQGSIYLTADDTNAPYINILANVDAFTDWGTSACTFARIGNLNGSYGISANYYGLGFGDYLNSNYLRYETNGGLVLVAGSGKVAINSDGVNITAGAVWDENRAYRFLSSAGAFFAGVDSQYAAASHYIRLQTKSIAGHESHSYLEAYAPSGQVVSTRLFVTSGGATGSLSLQGVDSSGIAVYSSVDIRVDTDARIGGGLYVGGTATDPAAGDITATNGINVGTATGATAGQVHVSGRFRVTGAGATDTAFSSLVSGDTQNRHYRRVDGALYWGSGAAAQDTNLYRSAADTLYTDDTFSALTLVDRTPMPAGIAEAYAAVASIRSLAADPRSVDHAALAPVLQYRNPETHAVEGRNLSTAVSALMLVVADLTTRLETIEGRA